MTTTDPYAAVNEQPLFPGYDPPSRPAEPDRTLSAGQRLTQRQAADVRAGKHPLMGGPLRPDADRYATKDDKRTLPFTCGSCVHRSQGGFPKCEVGPQSRGPATDVRAWWPACPKWEANPDGGAR